jgi:hypothetical protein
VHTEDVRRVLVIGSGTMGLQIGLQSATHGYDLVLYGAAQMRLPQARNAFAPTATLTSQRGSSTPATWPARWPASPCMRTPPQPRSGSADDNRTNHP